jgi:hypothetical protein
MPGACGTPRTHLRMNQTAANTDGSSSAMHMAICMFLDRRSLATTADR